MFKRGDSRNIKRTDFLMIQDKTAQVFTIDAFADDDGTNAMCTKFYAPGTSFFNQNLCESGPAHLWINAPFHLIEQTINKYIQEKGTSPNSLSACILVPAWKGASWYKLLQGMQKIYTFPQGYPLFESVQPDGSRGQMKGIPWDVEIYYDPPYKPLKVKATKVEGALTMQFPCTLNGAQAVVTTDSAASHSFINYQFTQKVGIACTPDTEWLSSQMAPTQWQTKGVR